MLEKKGVRESKKTTSESRAEVLPVMVPLILRRVGTYEPVMAVEDW